MRRAKSRGYATLLVMLMLVLGTTLSAWLYTMVQNATAVARNEQASARTRMVSESGLAYMQLKLAEACRENPIEVIEDETQMLMQLGSALATQLPAGRVEIKEDAAAVPYVEVATTDVKGGAFVASLMLSDNPSYTAPGFKLKVKGTAGTFSRTIGVEYLLGDAAADAWMNFPMLSRGDMVINGDAKVHHWNTEKWEADDDITGTPYDIDAGHAMTFDDVAPPADLQFPAKYLPASVYAKLDSLKGSAILPVYSTTPSGGDAGAGKKGGGKGKPGTGTAVESLSNCYIPAGSNIVLADGATLSGVIYVGYPSNITFSTTVTVNGVIIYEKPAVEPTADDEHPVITLDRTISITSNATATEDAVKALMLSSGETAEAAEAYANSVYPWTIHAPDTDMQLIEGNTGSVSYSGSFHINNFLKAAGDGTGNPDRYVIHGTIVCEGDVTMTGNRSFSVSPEKERRPNGAPEYLALQMRPGGYWEE